jgi:hypothetical protein
MMQTQPVRPSVAWTTASDPRKSTQYELNDHALERLGESFRHPGREKIVAVSMQQGRSDSMADKLAALCGRPVRVLDLAALAPGHDRIIDDRAQDSYDLIRGVRLEALAGARGADATRALLVELAGKTGVCLIEHAAATEAPSVPLRDLFAFVHELTPHEASRLGTQWPASFASNRYWYLGGQLDIFDRFLTEPYVVPGGVHGNTRRYFFGAGILVKVHRYDDPGRAAANRETRDREVAFLRDPPPGLAVPPLLFAGETQREGWLARGCLEGDLLLDLMIAGGTYDAATIVRDVLAQLVVLERSGLYHGDVRAWNVIVGSDGHASLIDYASISARPVDNAWPRDVFLSFLIFAREVHGRVTTLWPSIRRPWLDPVGLPEAHAFWSLLESPPETWSFARLQQDIERAPATTANSAVRPILAAFEMFDREAEDQRSKRDAEFEAALSGKDAALQAHAGEIERLAGELTAARSQVAATERALTDAGAREIALDRAHSEATRREAALRRDIASILRSKSWRATAPLRFARRWFDALRRGFTSR